MAKETKVERAAREMYERGLYQAAQKETYHQRLMSAIQRAQASNFELSVKGMQFVLYDRDDRDCEKIALDLIYDENVDDCLDRLQHKVCWKEECEAEANRRLLVRSCALHKLTAEEKDILGIS